jgi:2-phosphoglycerate kinase
MRRPQFDLAQVAAWLRLVRWIGGGSGGGKSTIARQLAVTYGLQLYSTDAVMADHASRSTPADAPLLHAFMGMDMDERWVNRTPEMMLQTFHWFAGEGFELIVEDLLALPEESPVVVEGFRLLPRLVAPLLSHPDQAIWLIPTPEFRRAAFDSRGSTWEIPGKTNHPEQALANLLARDQLFTDKVAREASALHVRAIEVDGATGVGALTQRVAHHLGLSAT